MQMHNDSLLPVRAQLFAQIETLERDCRTMTLPALHEAIDAISITARDYRLDIVESIACAFERAVVRNRQQTAFALYFDQLKQATGCRPDSGRAARDAMLAAISVRQAG